MTAKRFVINNGMTLDSKIEKYKLSCVVDNENKTFYFIVDDLANVESFVERLNELHEENEQLKARNDRQAKRLAELYELMAKKDWESLTEIIDDFCSCEEQLQRESGTYGGLE